MIRNGMLPRSDCWGTECYLVRDRLACGQPSNGYLFGEVGIFRRSFPRISLIVGGSLSPTVRVLSIAFGLIRRLGGEPFVFSRLGTYV